MQHVYTRTGAHNTSIDNKNISIDLGNKNVSFIVHLFSPVKVALSLLWVISA